MRVPTCDAGMAAITMYCVDAIDCTRCIAYAPKVTNTKHQACTTAPEHTGNANVDTEYHCQSMHSDNELHCTQCNCGNEVRLNVDLPRVSQPTTPLREKVFQLGHALGSKSRDPEGLLKAVQPIQLLCHSDHLLLC